MGLEIVLSRIIADAQAEARRIEQSGVSESGKILGEAEKSAAKLLSKAEASSKQKIASIRKSEAAKANAAVRIARMNARNSLLSEAEAGVFDELSRLPQAARKKYYSRLLKAGSKEIKPSYFYCSAQDKELISALAPSLSFAGDIPCSGGFILEDEGRKIRVDYTFEALMKKVLSGSKKALLKVLFDKNA